METVLTDLERAVLEKLLDGDDPVLQQLRKQLYVGVVTEREFTGTGFFTKILVPDGMAVGTPRRTFKIGDVVADIDGLTYGAGFLLYVEDGQLHMLEGYSYDEAWPSTVGRFNLSYASGMKRDTKAVREKWS